MRELAKALGAVGLHLPERDLGKAGQYHGQFKRLTGATHGLEALQAARLGGLDAALLSPVFASDSPSAGPALGVERFRSWVAQAGLPVYGLGGINETTIVSLAESGACGVAAVSALTVERQV